VSFISNGVCQAIRTLPIRYCPNVCVANHILRMLIVGILCRCFPSISRYWVKQDCAFSAILRAHVICDITGGDSFSDIYGFQGYFKNYLLKRVCQTTKRPYILLPQTYGPFKHCLSRYMAKIVFKNTHLILSRDSDSLELVKELMPAIQSEHYSLSPDVAFILEPLVVDDSVTHWIRSIKADGYSLIGLNISGLLYHNGYTGQNEFGLALDYKELVYQMAAELTAMKKVKLLLVPHVVPCEVDGYIESDLEASKALLQLLDPCVKKHMKLVQGDYDQCAIKNLIGQCDFFIGSRMHSTIASLSQKIPTVGLAYSKKFSGVYQSIGMGDCVLDLRNNAEQEIVSQCLELYKQKDELEQRLRISVPEAQEKVRALLNYVNV